MAGIGPMELVIVLAIALLVMGPKRLPQVGRQLGSGMREFKGAITGATGQAGSTYDDVDDDVAIHLREAADHPR